MVCAWGKSLAGKMGEIVLEVREELVGDCAEEKGGGKSGVQAIGLSWAPGPIQGCRDELGESKATVRGGESANGAPKDGEQNRDKKGL